MGHPEPDERVEGLGGDKGAEQEAGKDLLALAAHLVSAARGAGAGGAGQQRAGDISHRRNMD